MTRTLTAVALSIAATTASAHFGMIIPSDAMVEQQGNRVVSLDIAFAHPFEQYGMTLVRPSQFSVIYDGEATDLTDRLETSSYLGSDSFSLEYELTRPGVYLFAMAPEPYWEPAEDAFIIHYTKTYVAAFGDDEGWDAEAGFPTEIMPLTRPFGLWAGNVFQGIVMTDGEPVPYAEVEVEFINTDSAITAPSELMITQTILADANGVFTYAAPRAGWWGFAALSEADYTLTMNGEEKEVELGAVIWVHFESWQ
ncbi:MAG: DUF4198 domain-containing protein [Saccharospirillum sp.]|nr:DUF4198 domain-containing protein [Saccharospirillum sp.]